MAGAAAAAQRERRQFVDFGPSAASLIRRGANRASEDPAGAVVSRRLARRRPAARREYDGNGNGNGNGTAFLLMSARFSRTWRLTPRRRLIARDARPRRSVGGAISDGGRTRSTAATAALCHGRGGGGAEAGRIFLLLLRARVGVHYAAEEGFGSSSSSSSAAAAPPLKSPSSFSAPASSSSASSSRVTPSNSKSSSSQQL